MEVSTPVSFRVQACSFRPRRLADSTGHGSLYSSSFPAPTNEQVSFVYSERKEETWRGYGSERAAPFPRFWVLTFSVFAFLAVAREKESERLGHIVLPFFYFVVCARFYVD